MTGQAKEQAITTYQIWESVEPDGAREITLATREACERMRFRGQLGACPKLKHVFEAASEEEARQRAAELCEWTEKP